MKRASSAPFAMIMIRELYSRREAMKGKQAKVVEPLGISWVIRLRQPLCGTFSAVPDSLLFASSWFLSS
jgi:hypothetical protein